MKRSKEGIVLRRRWISMIARCSDRNLVNYGGKGISVCAEWVNSFESFYEWSLQNGFDEKLTIERIDSKGNYSPSNCKWATYKEQNRNRRNNKIINIDGVQKSMAEWSEISGISYETIKRRINVYGWDAKSAIFDPINKKFQHNSFKTKNDIYGN